MGHIKHTYRQWNREGSSIMTREDAYRKIEEHIDVLANYGVIDVDVAEMLKTIVDNY